jgi:linoleoyl-CoA desaturase
MKEAVKSKANIRFVSPQKTDFFLVLKKRVDQYFEDNKISRNANAGMVLKTIILLSAYIGPFVYMLIAKPDLGITLLMWTIMGFALAGIGMSIMHDANHGAYSSNEKINTWVGYTLNLCGGAIFNWKIQHNLMHHTYTNISNYDEDIEDKLIMKFDPHTQVKWYHRFQWFMAFVLYGIITLYWVTLKDFVQYNKYIKNGINRNSPAKNRVVLTKIILLKLIYFFVILALPIFIIGIPALYVLSGFVLMHFIGGFILSTVFQLAHTVDGTDHPLPNKDGVIENDWAIHQMQTTMNFCRGNKIISWYVGGLNYQVEHHLFSRISHVHYPAISHIVKATAEEYGVPYLENPTLMGALSSHVKALKKFGKLPDLNEVMG